MLYIYIWSIYIYIYNIIYILEYVEYLRISLEAFSFFSRPESNSTLSPLPGREVESTSTAGGGAGDRKKKSECWTGKMLDFWGSAEILVDSYTNSSVVRSFCVVLMRFCLTTGSFWNRIVSLQKCVGGSLSLSLSVLFVFIFLSDSLVLAVFSLVLFLLDRMPKKSWKHLANILLDKNKSRTVKEFSPVSVGDAETLLMNQKSGEHLFRNW